MQGSVPAELVPPSPVDDSSELIPFTNTAGSAYVEVSGSSTQVITENILTETNVSSMTELLSSVNANVGIVNVNQASGNLNNQANLSDGLFHGPLVCRG
jgi:hypothetical protein